MPEQINNNLWSWAVPTQIKTNFHASTSSRKEHIGTWNEPWELNVVIFKLVCYHWQALFTSYLDCFRELELFKPYNNLNELVELLINECNRKLNDNTNKIFISN